jgi:hypothetical protein
MIYGIPKPQPGDYATAISRWSIKLQCLLPKMLPLGMMLRYLIFVADKSHGNNLNFKFTRQH